MYKEKQKRAKKVREGKVVFRMKEGLAVEHPLVPG